MSENNIPLAPEMKFEFISTTDILELIRDQQNLKHLLVLNHGPVELKGSGLDRETRKSNQTNITLIFPSEWNGMFYFEWTYKMII